MKYSVLLEKLSSILLLLKNVWDVIVLPPSGSPLLHQCFSIVRMLLKKKKKKENVLFKTINEK